MDQVKKRKQRKNYYILAGNEEIEDIDLVQIINTNNNDEEWEPELTSDVSDDTPDVFDDERI